MTTADELTEAEARLRLILADHDRRQQEIKLAPRQVFAQLLAAFAASITAAAALLGAGIAFGSWMALHRPPW